MTPSAGVQTPVGQVRFDVPPQDLDSALTGVADRGGVRIFFPSSGLAGIRSDGVTGSMSVEEALSRVLAGTGFTWRPQQDRTIVIERLPATPGAITLGPVRVQGAGDDAGGGGSIDAVSPTTLGAVPAPYAGGQIASGGRLGVLGNRSTFETPFSITNYTDTYRQDIQARTLSDILLNDASVNTQWPRNTFTERFQIRGFQVSGNTIAGLAGLDASYLTIPEAYERIEVTRGPNALLNGLTPVGGVINLTPKQAGSVPVTRVTATYAARSQFGGHIDVGRRFGTDGAFGVRVNGVYRNGDLVADNEAQKIALLSLTADYNRGPLRLVATGTYEKTFNRAPRSQIYPNFTSDDFVPPDAEKSYQQKWEFARSESYLGILRAELDLATDVTAFASGGLSQGREQQLRDIAEVLSLDGSANSSPYRFSSWSDNISVEAGVRAKVATGGITHRLVASYARSHSTSGSQEGSYAIPGFPAGFFPNNIYNPVVVPAPDLPFLTAKGPKQGEYASTGLTVADTIFAFADKVQLTAGVRRQRVETTGFDSATGAVTQRYDRSRWTPAIALLVKPFGPLSIYGNYIQGLEQGPVAPDLTVNRGEIFPPNKTEQYEAGIKLDLKKLAVTLAAYQITQPIGRTVPEPGSTLPRFTVDGRQRNRGIELTLFGEPVPGVRLLASAAYLDPILLETQDDSLNGSKATGNSDIAVNLNAEWDTPFLPGLTLTGRVAYQSSQLNYDYASISGWTRFDLGARYATDLGGVPVVFRATVENAANKNYWLSAANGYLLASARTVLLSASFDF